ncbi:MAG: hypothetical protein ACJ763_11455 [Bdellovibrionia bacterium]
MKKNLGWITMTAVMAASPLAPAMAEDAVPFQACKNVRIVKTDAEKKALEAKGCAAAVEVATPKIGANLSSSLEAAKIGAMLGDVAKDQYLKDLDKRTKYWVETKKCFESSSPSADCKKKVDEIKGQYGAFVGDLRKNLARSNLSSKDGKHQISSELKPFTSSKLPFIPNAFPEAVTGNLQKSEFEVYNDGVARNGAKEKEIEAAAKADYASTLSNGIQKNGLYLVAYLPKPSGASANGSPEWSNGEWSKTIDRLIQDAQHEKDVTEKAIAKGTVTFPAFSTRDMMPTFDKNERDLMYYATLTPEMEKYLAKNPQDCGAAIAATQWMHKLEWEKMGASFAAFAVTGAGAGAATKLTGAGKMLSLASMASGGWVGAAMTYNDYQKVQAKAEDTFKQVAKIGVEKGKEEDVVDAKQYAEAQEAADHWVRNTALMQGGFLAGGAVVGKAAPTIAKALVSKTKSAKEGLARLMMKSKDPKKFADGLETLAAKSADYRTNLGANLTSPEVMAAREINLALRKDLDRMEQSGSLKGEDLAQVEDVLLDAHPRVAQRLEAEGKCKGAACMKAAAAEEDKALREAEGACVNPKAAK